MNDFTAKVLGHDGPVCALCGIPTNKVRAKKVPKEVPAKKGDILYFCHLCGAVDN